MSETQAFFDILIKHILKIYDENDSEILYSNISIKEEKRKYSSSISRVFYIDNKPLSNKQQRCYKILYKCRCNSNVKILLFKYLKKTRIVCQHCLQDSSYEYHVIPNKTGKGNKVKSCRLKNLKSFEEMSEEFKKEYNKKHLTPEEFYHYLPKIYSINNILLSDINIEKIKYQYANHTNNQMKFTPKISFDNGLTYNSIKNIYLKCSICGKVFRIHTKNLKTKDIDNIRCKMCGLTNHRYAIRLYDESGLTYQSNLEKKFIDLCKKSNIDIVNGLKIDYIFNNKNKTYITDFYLPKYKFIIEIKSINQFYKNDLKSGKFQSKVDAATLFAKNNDMKYFVLFDEDIEEFIENLNLKR